MDDPRERRRVVILQVHVDAEARSERPREQSAARRGADEREGCEVDLYRARAGPLVDQDVDAIILHRRVEVLLHDGAEAVDLVDEEHVVFLERRQQSGQVARLVEHRPRRHLEAHAQLVGDDVRERRLAQARRAVQQHMVERFLTHASGHDEHLQVLHHLALAAEAVEREGAQGVLIVALRLRRCAGSLAYVEFSHRCVSYE